MTTLINNFDGGPDGTDLTSANSGQSNNDAFDLTDTASASKHIEFKDAAALGRGTAEFVLWVSTSSATSAGVMWSTSMGSQSQIWFRQYMYLTQLPSDVGAVLDHPIFECDNGAVYTGWVEIGSSSGHLNIYNGAESVSVGTTTVVPTNQWFRIGVRMLFSTTVGSVELRLYLDPDSDTPDETISASGWNMGAASANSFAFGYPATVTNRPTMYISGLELNNTGWPGPAPFRAGKGVPGIQPNPIAIHQDLR